MTSRNVFRVCLVIFSCLLIAACDTSDNFAPVTDAGSFEPVPHAGIHTVRHGETLYEIAWRYGMDYRDLATRNHMHSPYVLYSGQLIYLRGRRVNQIAAHVPVLKTVKVVQSASIVPEPVNAAIKWFWPAKGKIINYFSEQNKGINIAGNLGEPIYSAAAGRVVYCGSGLRGYGNLIIIKHDNVYLSAYAHNRSVFVKEGDWIQRGQKIAEMGNAGAEKVMLHFEIRQAGKPVDPTMFYSLPM
jgi:lipoprotein NlpD